MAKEVRICFSRIINPIRFLLSNGVKHSLDLMILSSLILVFCGGMTLTTANQAAAADGNWWQTAQNGGLNQVGQAFGNSGQPRDIRSIVIDIIKVVLSLLGILSVILIVYAGYKWMLSGGNEETVGEAKKMLIAGVIGLAIILSAYMIADFVINQIYGAVTGIPVIQ